MFLMQTKGLELDALVSTWTAHSKDLLMESTASKGDDQHSMSVDVASTSFCEQLMILAKREMQKVRAFSLVW